LFLTNNPANLMDRSLERRMGISNPEDIQHRKAISEHRRNLLFWRLSRRVSNHLIGCVQKLTSLPDKDRLRSIIISNDFPGGCIRKIEACQRKKCRTYVIQGSSWGKIITFRGETHFQVITKLFQFTERRISPCC